MSGKAFFNLRIGSKDPKYSFLESKKHRLSVNALLTTGLVLATPAPSATDDPAMASNAIVRIKESVTHKPLNTSMCSGDYTVPLVVPATTSYTLSAASCISTTVILPAPKPKSVENASLRAITSTPLKRVSSSAVGVHLPLLVNAWHPSCLDASAAVPEVTIVPADDLHPRHAMPDSSIVSATPVAMAYELLDQATLQIVFCGLEGKERPEAFRHLQSLGNMLIQLVVLMELPSLFPGATADVYKVSFSHLIENQVLIQWQAKTAQILSGLGLLADAAIECDFPQRIAAVANHASIVTTPILADTFQAFVGAIVVHNNHDMTVSYKYCREALVAHLERSALLRSITTHEEKKAAVPSRRSKKGRLTESAPRAVHRRGRVSINEIDSAAQMKVEETVAGSNSCSVPQSAQNSCGGKASHPNLPERPTLYPRPDFTGNEENGRDRANGPRRGHGGQRKFKPRPEPLRRVFENDGLSPDELRIRDGLPPLALKEDSPGNKAQKPAVRIPVDLHPPKRQLAAVIDEHEDSPAVQIEDTWRPPKRKEKELCEGHGEDTVKKAHSPQRPQRPVKRIKRTFEGLSGCKLQLDEYMRKHYPTVDMNYKPWGIFQLGVCRDGDRNIEIPLVIGAPLNIKVTGAGLTAADAEEDAASQVLKQLPAIESK
ncbi:hypothetical protein DACRYDRAFT_17987 [Dacryopinax primogenitus]|uniref:RNase III domain-containing protein n=1 Tax=Dacryopinax primogenitus (strain DJM 731) TaxID=1858805 RepID=M5FXQ8_DACPD|nr:uncharacterized protein DACRYDRAFT_17987 [Dacryopinax primogenitus]EJT98301.1 hypothetical protein DACRYDRAFT_17987 [Dacryopinax primogenitus]